MLAARPSDGSHTWPTRSFPDREAVLLRSYSESIHMRVSPDNERPCAQQGYEKCIQPWRSELCGLSACELRTKQSTSVQLLLSKEAGRHSQESFPGTNRIPG